MFKEDETQYCKNCYELKQQLDLLKAEVKSKTEYIQEQRDIINQYSKEIEMYKKCQGKRASKREEELKVENDELKRQRTAYIKEAEENFEVHTTLKDNYRKLYQTLTEIKVLSENVYCLTNALNRDMALFAKEIIQKISEVEDA